jgi:hypothetical protein
MDEKEYEYEYPSYVVREDIDKLCLQIEELKLTAWDLLQTTQSEMITNGQMTAAERKIDAHAEYDGEVLKITVNDLPPRTGPPDTHPGGYENRYWFLNLIWAIDRLDLPSGVFSDQGSGPDAIGPGAIATKPSCDRALCAIKVYWKRDVRWDVDNRVLYTIASALRMAGIIPCQGWDKIAFLLVLGGVDRKNPRTEICITKYPEDTTAKLFESI